MLKVLKGDWQKDILVPVNQPFNTLRTVMPLLVQMASMIHLVATVIRQALRSAMGIEQLIIRSSRWIWRLALAIDS